MCIIPTRRPARSVSSESWAEYHGISQYDERRSLSRCAWCVFRLATSIVSSIDDDSGCVGDQASHWLTGRFAWSCCRTPESTWPASGASGAAFMLGVVAVTAGLVDVRRPPQFGLVVMAKLLDTES